LAGFGPYWSVGGHTDGRLPVPALAGGTSVYRGALPAAERSGVAPDTAQFIWHAPYELSRTLRDNGDARSIKFNHGSLYMVVGQLAKAGFITEQENNREGQRPERTVYALTDAGRHELRDWLRELVAQPQHEYSAFVGARSR
jgi:Transcriptional regulator PadR-like family